MNFEIKDGTLCKYIGKEKEVIIPDNVEEIDAQAFLDCDTVESIVIPDGIECYVKGYAFEHCSTVKKIYFGNGVCGIGSENEMCGTAQSVFRCCDSLECIEVSEDNSLFSSKDGVLYNKDKTEILFDPKEPDWKYETEDE